MEFVDSEGGVQMRGLVVMAAVGPLRLFVNVRSCTAAARRGKGSPPGAHAVAVGAAHRLHCAARSGVAPPNSLRSLRSLRSDTRGESVDEARAAHAPTPALRCSSPPKSRPAGSPRREIHGRWRSLQRPPRGLPARAFARADLCARSSRSRSATSRKQPSRPAPAFARRRLNPRTPYQGRTFRSLTNSVV